MLINQFKRVFKFLFLACSVLCAACTNIYFGDDSESGGLFRFSKSKQEETPIYHEVGEEVMCGERLKIVLLGYTDSRGANQKIIGPRFSIENLSKTDKVYTLSKLSWELNLDGYLYTPQSYWGSYYLWKNSGISDQGLVPGEKGDVEPNFRVAEQVYENCKELIVRVRGEATLYWKFNKGENYVDF